MIVNFILSSMKFAGCKFITNWCLIFDIKIFYLKKTILFKKPCKKFKDQLVLDEINLFVSKNKVYYLSGSNYAHKTTITKILTGMISALSRQDEFSSHEWTWSNLPNINSVIKNALLYDNLTTKENLQVLCRLPVVKEK